MVDLRQPPWRDQPNPYGIDRKSTRLNSSHTVISYAVFCLKKKISNDLGTVNPVKKIVSMVHAHGAAVLIDGALAVSHLRVDVRDLDFDFYDFSWHKAYAPT